jgi:YegS/Rv2252/BmrU family lipid kinase
MDDRALLVLNPISGGGIGRRVLPRFREALSRRGMESEVFETERAGDARRVARERGGDFRWVVAMGGDGTINEILNGLEDPTATAIGAYPTGTSNILARELALPRNPERAAAIIAAREVREFDVGEANGRRFLACAGVGWDADVLRRLEEVRRGPISHATYLQPIAKAVMGWDFPEIRCRVDGEAITGSLLFVGNIKNYAAFFTVTPEARFDSGVLDVTAIRGGHKRDFLRWFAAAFAGRLTVYKDVICRRGRHIEIDADRPLPFQVDGDCVGETPLTITVRPAGARILVDGRKTP